MAGVVGMELPSWDTKPEFSIMVPFGSILAHFGPIREWPRMFTDGNSLVYGHWVNLGPSWGFFHEGHEKGSRFYGDGVCRGVTRRECQRSIAKRRLRWPVLLFSCLARLTPAQAHRALAAKILGLRPANDQPLSVHKGPWQCHRKRKARKLIVDRTFGTGRPGSWRFGTGRA